MAPAKRKGENTTEEAKKPKLQKDKDEEPPKEHLPEKDLGGGDVMTVEEALGQIMDNLEFNDPICFDGVILKVAVMRRQSCTPYLAGEVNKELQNLETQKKVKYIYGQYVLTEGFDESIALLNIVQNMFQLKRLPGSVGNKLGKHDELPKVDHHILAAVQSYYPYQGSTFKFVLWVTSKLLKNEMQGSKLMKLVHDELQTLIRKKLVVVHYGRFYYSPTFVFEDTQAAYRLIFEEKPSGKLPTAQATDSGEVTSIRNIVKEVIKNLGPNEPTTFDAVVLYIACRRSQTCSSYIASEAGKELNKLVIDGKLKFSYGQYVKTEDYDETICFLNCVEGMFHCQKLPDSEGEKLKEEEIRELVKTKIIVTLQSCFPYEGCTFKFILWVTSNVLNVSIQGACLVKKVQQALDDLLSNTHSESVVLFHGRYYFLPSFNREQCEEGYELRFLE